MKPLDPPTNPLALFVHLALLWICDNDEDEHTEISFDRIFSDLSPYLNDEGRKALHVFFTEAGARITTARIINSIGDQPIEAGRLP